MRRPVYAFRVLATRKNCPTVADTPLRGPSAERRCARTNSRPHCGRPLACGLNYQKERQPHGVSADTPLRGPLGGASLRSHEQPAALRPPARVRFELPKRETGFKKPVSLFGSPTGTRTPVFAVRGRRLNRLTMRPFSNLPNDYIIKNKIGQMFLRRFSCFFMQCRTFSFKIMRAELTAPPDFYKEGSACAAERKSVNPLLAGGCAACRLSLSVHKQTSPIGIDHLEKRSRIFNVD